MAHKHFALLSIKTFRIRSFFWYIFLLVLKTQIYGSNFRIQCKIETTRTKKNSIFGKFHLVLFIFSLDMKLAWQNRYDTWFSSVENPWKILLWLARFGTRYFIASRTRSNFSLYKQDLISPRPLTLNHFLQGTEACNFFKKETLVQVFSCEFFQISKNTFFFH